MPATPPSPADVLDKVIAKKCLIAGIFYAAAARPPAKCLGATFIKTPVASSRPRPAPLLPAIKSLAPLRPGAGTAERRTAARPALLGPDHNAIWRLGRRSVVACINAVGETAA